MSGVHPNETGVLVTVDDQVLVLQRVNDAVIFTIHERGFSSAAPTAEILLRFPLWCYVLHCLSDIAAFLGRDVSERAAPSPPADMRAALKEALDAWEDAAQYKGDFLREKHGDAADIARLRKLLEDS